MLDLFNAPLLPGLASQDDLITPAEEQALIAAIDAADLSPYQFHGWTGKRMTVAYGWRYDVGAGQLRRGDPLPDWLVPFRDRVARFTGVPAGDFSQALLIRYDPGAGIGWHKDRSAFGHVVGLSLGAPATMRFRRRHGERFARVNMPLEPRGAYHLSGPARHEWEHSIAEMDRTRWSVTFRTLQAPTGVPQYRRTGALTENP